MDMFIVIISKLNPHPRQQRHEFLVQSPPFNLPAPQQEQKPETHLILPWINTVLVENIVVGGEDGTEGETVDVRMLFCACYDLMEDVDVYETRSRKIRYG